ncbi:TolC family protein [Leptothrix sp. BB-4]
MTRHRSRRPSFPASLAVLATLAVLAGCAQLPAPSPIGEADHQARIAADKAAIVRDVEPVGARLGLDEAIARALKHNLDRRARQLEQAMALQQYDASGYDTLPRLVAAAGYSARDSDRLSRSVNAVTGQPLGADPSVSQSRQHTLLQMDLTWNLLDYGLARYSTEQAADRVMAAAERRRKATHLLVQDVRVAYWRAASAQRLRGEVREALQLADEAMVDARRAEDEKLRAPLDSLRYQRQLTENMRLLESIEQELVTARYELAGLINIPVMAEVRLDADATLAGQDLLAQPVEAMEEQALAQNADLREQAYQRRIAVTEVRKVVARAWPNLSFSLGARYDTDSYLVHKSWNEAGMQASYNLFNLLSRPAQERAAQAGVALADQRRLAAHVAVITQVHVARAQLAGAAQQFRRADALWELDAKIMDQLLKREQAQAGSKLERVAAQTTSIVSLLRRYQALAQLHAATSRLQATLGIDPLPDSSDDLSLDQIREQVRSRLLAS